MLTETDDEVLEAESCADALPNVADVGMDAVYKAGVWRHLQGGRQGAASGSPSRSAQKRC